MRPRHLALALCALALVIRESPVARADEPAPEGNRRVDTRPRNTGAADGGAAEAPRPEIVAPRARSDTRVEYPDGGVGDAVVELELSISAGGQVTRALVIAGQPPFAEAARAAAELWQFEPASKGGSAVASRIRFRVGFEQRRSEESDAAISAGAPAATGSSQAPAATPGSVTPPRAAPGATTASPTSVAPVPVAPAPEPLAVTVLGDRPPGARIISRAFARELPGAFNNPFAAIEASPGVTPTLSGAPYFYVRGAPPGNLGYFIDDIRLPTLFHVLAGPSVVHPAMIESLEFHPGPYPARYGRFTGGIAAGQVRRASYESHGELSVRAFDSSGLLEIPLGTSPVTSSLTLAGRVAYANPIAHLFAPEISVSYWDYQARSSHRLSSRDELVALAFGSRDALDRTDDDGEREVVFGAEFHRLQLRYQHAFESGSLRVMALGGWDRSDQADGDVQLTNTSGRLRADLVHELGPRTRLDAGLDLGFDRYSLELAALEDADERQDYLERYPARTDSVAGGHVGARMRLTPALRVELGSRVDLFGSNGTIQAAVSPSVFAEFDITPALTLIHALGVAHQPPSSDVPEPGANPVLGSGLQHAVQSSAGIRLKLPAELRLEATLYQAALFNLTDGIGISRVDNGDDGIDRTSRALGQSHGLELLIERELGQSVAGYLAYTLGSSRRFVGRAQGPALFDRRHVLSGALSWRFGSGLRAGVRGTFYTGVPADVAYLAAARNPPRTSAFYRIDTRIEKRWRLGDHGAFWAIVLEVLNTTLHEEALGKSCSAYVCREDTVGPLTIPSLGLEAMF
jgi:hypothetical protein